MTVPSLYIRKELPAGSKPSGTSTSLYVVLPLTVPGWQSRGTLGLNFVDSPFSAGTPLVPCPCTQSHLCSKFIVSEQSLQTGVLLPLSRINTCAKENDSTCGNHTSGENKKKRGFWERGIFPRPQCFTAHKGSRRRRKEKIEEGKRLGLSQASLSVSKNKLVE